MRLFRRGAAAVLLALAAAGLSPAHADQGAPTPIAATAAPPVVTEPTAPPVVVPPPVTEPTVAAPIDQPTQPVQVSKEAPSAAETSVQPPTSAEPSAPMPTSQAGDVQASGTTAAQNRGPVSAGAAPSSGQTAEPSAPRNQVGQQGTSPSLPPGLVGPTDPGIVASQSTGTTLPDVNAASVSAAAPAQLVCKHTSSPVADPFLVAPFNGWTTVNSFLDHDSPDYALDGTIVIANGMTARSGDGQASDFFPSYWSTALRQYISYDGHNGYDFGISYQPILAAGDGTVTFSGWNGPSTTSGYGQMVLIDHHNGYVTLYGHLSKIEVHEGERVLAGQEIGISGSTGNSSGPHLHFSVFHNCQVTDPYGWTGQGRDPLTTFDDEHASYLWLPGHDPLVLNPPPHWPTFPLGLHVSIPHLRELAKQGRRVVPPIDRLLLLNLPAPQHAGSLTAAAALALTESRIVDEAASVAPYLSDLEHEGLVENYQVIPAAAAIWVRGTVSANQLLGLPGVASLSGVQPQDLVAAQSGLSHAVLIQLDAGQAPSLWPAGFRSALHTWRPVTTVAEGHALAAGFTLPGRAVALTLLRHGGAAAVATTQADPQSGGFVAMLHDARGNAVAAQSGDVLETRTGGRLSRVGVQVCSLKARATHVMGQAPSNASVQLSLTGADGTVIWHGVVFANAAGAFAMHWPAGTAAGTQAVASFVNAAGDNESVTAHVPGIVVTEGSNMIKGWAVGRAPQISLTRKGIVVYRSSIRPAADGSFRVQLMAANSPLDVHAGDRITIGSARHHHSVTIPGLALHVNKHNGTIRVIAPPFHTVAMEQQSALGYTATTQVPLGRAQQARASWRAGPVTDGTTAVASITYRTGDVVQSAAHLQRIHIDVTGAMVNGRSAPATTVSVRVASARGRDIGGGVVDTSRTGVYHIHLLANDGKPLHLKPGDVVTVREADWLRQAIIPAAVLRAVSSSRIVGTPGASRTSVTISRGTSRTHFLAWQKFSVPVTVGNPVSVRMIVRASSGIDATWTLTRPTPRHR